jgi:hypothetical protein
MAADLSLFFADLYVKNEDRKTPDEPIKENTKSSFPRKVISEKLFHPPV